MWFGLLVFLVAWLTSGAPSTSRDKTVDYSKRLIKDQYMVLLRENHTLDAHFAQIGIASNASLTNFTSLHLINGYGAVMSPSLLEQVKQDPGVEFVQQDINVYKPIPKTNAHHAHSRNTTRARKNAERRWNLVSSEDMPWWFRMVSEGTKLNTPVADADSMSFTPFGTGVSVFVMDSGIRLSHEVFEGRAHNFNGHTQSPWCGLETMDDLNGHGTAVASVIAEMTDNPVIVNVKISCDDPSHFRYQHIIEAFHNIIDQHRAWRTALHPPPGWRGSVINLSVGFIDNGTWDWAILKRVVEQAYNEGIPIIYAAGNDHEEENLAMCGPGGYWFPYVLCVGAIDDKYKMYVDSNYGPNVHIWAPGVDMTLAWHQGDDMYSEETGNSYAAPIVSSIFAEYIGYEKMIQDVATAQERLWANDQLDFIEGLPSGSWNRLVNTGLEREDKDARQPYKGAPFHEAPDSKTSP